jgi:hypothetical protein
MLDGLMGNCVRGFMYSIFETFFGRSMNLVIPCALTDNLSISPCFEYLVGSRSWKRGAEEILIHQCVMISP